MKAFLLFENNDFNSQQDFPKNSNELKQDLELNTLCNAMALGDEFLFPVIMKVILTGLYNDVDTIFYRQHILQDCLRNSSTIKAIYALAMEAIESKQRHWYGIFANYPSAILSDSIALLQLFENMLKKLKKIADEESHKFESKGFTRFFNMIKTELNEEYFTTVQNQLNELKFRRGVLISAELGRGNKGINYVLRKLQDKNESWFRRIFSKKSHLFTFRIHPRDEQGAKALSDLKDQGINLVANSLAQSADHILSFIIMLKTELSFYIGCVNLHERIVQMGMLTSFPVPEKADSRKHSFKELYDICLALNMEKKISGNDMHADTKDIVFVTGANQGGKSTFLRSIGLAQLMMQSGMFVAAECFSANICNSLFTHYKRKEDTSMNSGKLDEELLRMSDITDHITSNSMLLFNESFAATNEREGSEIAKQIVTALLENGNKIFYVTHLYEFAHGFYEKKLEDAIFFRAEREPGGIRNFKLMLGEPLQTSFGVDLYNRIFNI